MNWSVSRFGNQLRSSAAAIIEDWRHQCTHCRECQEKVTPFVAFCPKCGQKDPAQLSPSLPLVLCLAALAIVVVGGLSATLL